MFELIVTTGPALNSELLSKIHNEGNIIFRLNGAHLDRDGCSFEIDRIRSEVPNSRIMIDLPGNKIRTKNLSAPIKLTPGKRFELYPHQLNYEDFYKYLKKGDIVYANDSKYRFEVAEIKSGIIHFISINSGELENNKGLHLIGVNEYLPFLFQRDIELIDLAILKKVDFISLSFVRNVSDILEAIKILGNKKDNLKVIAKIETRQAVENLEEILELNCIDMINVDRGDLSSDIGIVELPFAVKKIVETARSKNKKIFLATHFLKFMENYPIPLLSEITGLHQVLELNVNGIQLSDETAVGTYPLECVKLVFQMEKAFLNRAIKIENIEKRKLKIKNSVNEINFTTL